MTATGQVTTARPTVPVVRAMVRDAVGDHLPGRATRSVVVAMSRDDNPKATVMVFTDAAPAPELVIKVALTTEASRAVSAEAGALLALEGLDPGRVGGTVPQCLDLRHGGGHAALVMSAQPGVPLAVGYHRWRHTARPAAVARDFACAAAWLRALAELSVAPAAQPDWSAMLCRRWPGEPAVVGAARVLEGIRERLDTSRTGRVCHGDFWCGNILRTGSAASGVVDWERSTFGGDNLADRVRFALSYSLYLDRHTPRGRPVRGHEGLVARHWGDGIRYALQGSGWYPNLLRGFVAEGLLASSRPVELWREALLLGLAEIAATSDHDGFGRDHLELFTELAR